MAKEKMDIAKKKCTTPKFRVSFPHVFEPHASKEGKPKRFRITMLFKKSTDLSALKRAVKNATIEEFGPDQKKWPKIRSPFRDGSEKEHLDGYKGCIFVSATAKNRPGVIDLDKIDISEESGDFYAGCYARATLIAFYYNEDGNKGISFALQNVQKLADGKPFSGKRDAASDFDDTPPESEEEEEEEEQEEEEEEEEGPGF